MKIFVRRRTPHYSKVKTTRKLLKTIRFEPFSTAEVGLSSLLSISNAIHYFVNCITSNDLHLALSCIVLWHKINSMSNLVKKIFKSDLFLNPNTSISSPLDGSNSFLFPLKFHFHSRSQKYCRLIRRSIIYQLASPQNNHCGTCFQNERSFILLYV